MSYDFTLLDLPSDLKNLRDVAYADPASDALQRFLFAVEPYSFHMNIRRDRLLPRADGAPGHARSW